MVTAPCSPRQPSGGSTRIWPCFDLPQSSLILFSDIPENCPERRSRPAICHGRKGAAPRPGHWSVPFAECLTRLATIPPLVARILGSRFGCSLRFRSGVYPGSTVMVARPGERQKRGQSSQIPAAYYLTRPPSIDDDSVRFRLCRIPPLRKQIGSPRGPCLPILTKENHRAKQVASLAAPVSQDDSRGQCLGSRAVFLSSLRAR